MINKALFSFASYTPTNETRGEGTRFGCADSPQTKPKESPGKLLVSDVETALPNYASNVENTPKQPRFGCGSRDLPQVRFTCGKTHTNETRSNRTRHPVPEKQTAGFGCGNRRFLELKPLVLQKKTIDSERRNHRFRMWKKDITRFYRNLLH